MSQPDLSSVKTAELRKAVRTGRDAVVDQIRKLLALKGIDPRSEAALPAVVDLLREAVQLGGGSLPTEATETTETAKMFLAMVNEPAANRN